MGLSDEERLSGVYYAIDSMMEIVKNLNYHKEEYDYPHTLINYVKEMWHAFIGKDSNGIHWVIGSSSSNEVTHYSPSIWGVAAINHHTDKVLKESKGPLEEFVKDNKNFFNAFDGFLDISGLLKSDGHFKSAIYDIYGWTEQVIYYLRRYDDKFLKEHEALSKVVSNVQGECFNLFKHDNVYARAYILNKICKFIYTDKYPYRSKNYDMFTRFLVKEHCQHHFTTPMHEHDIKPLAEIHVRLHRADKEKKLTAMMRAEAFLQVAGSSFHHDHLFNNLVKALNLKGLDLIKFKMLFIECKNKHEKKEKDSHERYRDDHGSPLSIYGYDVE
jgi:hypothetical protein